MLTQGQYACHDTGTLTAVRAMVTEVDAGSEELGYRGRYSSLDIRVATQLFLVVRIDPKDGLGTLRLTRTPVNP